MRQQSDRDLIELIGSEDVAALGALYDRHAALLAFRLRSSGASVEEAEDVIQETFIDVWRSAASYRGESPVAGWLWGIAWRKFAMLVRAEVRLRDRQARASTSNGPSSDAADWAEALDASGALADVTTEYEGEDQLLGASVVGIVTARADRVVIIWGSGEKTTIAPGEIVEFGFRGFGMISRGDKRGEPVAVQAYSCDRLLGSQMP